VYRLAREGELPVVKLGRYTASSSRPSSSSKTKEGSRREHAPWHCPHRPERQHFGAEDAWGRAANRSTLGRALRQRILMGAGSRSGSLECALAHSSI
jgi:hypothetical protein